MPNATRRTLKITPGYSVPADRMSTLETLEKIRRLIDREDQVPQEEFGRVLLWLAQEYRMAEDRELKAAESANR